MRLIHLLECRCRPTVVKCHYPCMSVQHSIDLLFGFSVEHLVDKREVKCGKGLGYWLSAVCSINGQASRTAPKVRVCIAVAFTLNACTPSRTGQCQQPTAAKFANGVGVKHQGHTAPCQCRGALLASTPVGQYADDAEQNGAKDVPDAGRFQSERAKGAEVVHFNGWKQIARHKRKNPATC